LPAANSIIIGKKILQLKIDTLLAAAWCFTSGFIN
jgi:hypothetical protein